MKKKIKTLDEYFSIGCGRCEKGSTDDCNVRRWDAEVQALKSLVEKKSLKPELKWSQPCYTHKGKIVVSISALNQGAVLSFFRGSLLKDSAKILEFPGENSKEDKIIRFSDVKAIKKVEKTLLKYIDEAVELINAGVKVPKSDAPVDIPSELLQLMDEDESLKDAFRALTKGRQRSYALHINSAKQEKTRQNRAEKCIPKIMDGLGFNEYAK